MGCGARTFSTHINNGEAHFLDNICKGELLFFIHFYASQMRYDKMIMRSLPQKQEGKNWSWVAFAKKRSKSGGFLMSWK